MSFEGTVWVERKKETQVNFRTNKEILEQAKKVFASQNLDLTSSFNLFLENVVQENRLPFETAEDIEKKNLMAEFQMQVEKNMRDITQGKGISLDNARKKLLG